MRPFVWPTLSFHLSYIPFSIRRSAYNFHLWNNWDSFVYFDRLCSNDDVISQLNIPSGRWGIELVPQQHPTFNILVYVQIPFNFHLKWFPYQNEKINKQRTNEPIIIAFASYLLKRTNHEMRIWWELFFCISLNVVRCKLWKI